ncbi:MAG: AEC family transporter [Cellulomonadaceae bacterium]
MSGVLIGFAIIAAIIATGYVIGRIDLLGPQARGTLARLVFFVLSPALLFTVLADARVSDLFSPLLLVSLAAAAVSFATFGLVALCVWRRRLPEALIGMLCAGYVNANNIGIPVAVYVLGDVAYAAPVMLLQLLLISPVALAVLDARTSGVTSWRRVLAQPVRNPIIIGSAAGLLVAVTGVQVPVPVMEPFRIIGAAAVPLMLISYGISLSGTRVLQAGTGRRDVLLATAVKLLVMPAVAWALGHGVFSLTGQELFVVVALAALPTAQNVFNYAQRYGRGEVVARDTILLTTIGSMPVLVVAAALLH